jgi:hypothetical protein
MGFAHAPVLMANEAHSGLQRCVRTWQVGIRMVRAGPRGRAAGILCEQAPESLAGWPADAVVVSTDNALS